MLQVSSKIALPLVFALKAFKQFFMPVGSGPGKQWNAIQKVHQAALRQGIPCKTMSKHDLNVITNNAVHQVDSRYCHRCSCKNDCMMSFITFQNLLSSVELVSSKGPGQKSKLEQLLQGIKSCKKVSDSFE